MQRKQFWAALVAALGVVLRQAKAQQAEAEPIIITPAGPPQFGPPTVWPNGLCGACKIWAAPPIPAAGPDSRIVECGWCHTLYVQQKEAPTA